MKKLFSTLVVAAMFLGLGSNAFAAEEDNDVERAMEMIEKTNVEIEEKVLKAVEKADNLQQDYLTEIRQVEEGKEVVKLKEEKEKALIELEINRHDQKKFEKILEKIEKVDAKIDEEKDKIDSKITEIEQEIDELETELFSPDVSDKEKEKLNKKIVKLGEKLTKKAEKAEEKTNKYTEGLEKVIEKVYDETLKMSNETIEKAAELGVQAECSWKLVRFADKWVWIDPIRVVGCN
ncbi:hypothetical protein ACOJQI_22460 [Bacillus salacetis]|uniref:hypothetical protein n=1 Tax=Bacillus salacetis TaxID=2315464 RepID=UPI003BA2A849